MIGRITKIACAGGKVVYTVKTEKETITLFSKDFENLALVSLAEESGNIQVGCNENIAAVNTVLTFKDPVKPGANGELLAIDFVPGSFKFVAVDKSKAPSDVFDINNSNSKNSNLEDQTKDAMLDAIRNAMRKVQDGEKREQGFIEKIECDNKGMYMFFKTDTQIIKLSRISPTIPITAFTPDIQGIQFGCGLKQLDILVVFTYKPNADPKSKIPGDLISLEFMPKSFKLENF